MKKNLQFNYFKRMINYVRKVVNKLEFIKFFHVMKYPIFVI